MLWRPTCLVEEEVLLSIDADEQDALPRVDPQAAKAAHGRLEHHSSNCGQAMAIGGLNKSQMLMALSFIVSQVAPPSCGPAFHDIGTLLLLLPLLPAPADGTLKQTSAQNASISPQLLQQGISSSDPSLHERSVHQCCGRRLPPRRAAAPKPKSPPNCHSTVRPRPHQVSRAHDKERTRTSNGPFCSP